MKPVFVPAERVWQMQPEDYIQVNRLHLLERVTNLTGYGKNPTPKDIAVAQKIKRILSKYPDEDERYISLQINDVTELLDEGNCCTVTFILK